MVNTRYMRRSKILKDDSMKLWIFALFKLDTMNYMDIITNNYITIQISYGYVRKGDVEIKTHEDRITLKSNRHKRYK